MIDIKKPSDQKFCLLVNYTKKTKKKFLNIKIVKKLTPEKKIDKNRLKKFLSIDYRFLALNRRKEFFFFNY